MDEESESDEADASLLSNHNEKVAHEAALKAEYENQQRAYEAERQAQALRASQVSYQSSIPSPTYVDSPVTPYHRGAMTPSPTAMG